MGLLELRPWKPRTVGAIGVLTSVINCCESLGGGWVGIRSSPACLGLVWRDRDAELPSHCWLCGNKAPNPPSSHADMLYPAVPGGFGQLFGWGRGNRRAAALKTA